MLISVGMSYQTELSSWVQKHSDSSCCCSTGSQSHVGVAHNLQVPLWSAIIHEDGIKAGPEHPYEHWAWGRDMIFPAEVLCENSWKYFLLPRVWPYPTLRKVPFCRLISPSQIPHPNHSDTGSRWAWVQKRGQKYEAAWCCSGGAPDIINGTFTFPIPERSRRMWGETQKLAYPQEAAEEPVVKDKACHLQQSDERKLDGVGLPQDSSNGNERRGRAHLCNN